MAFSPQNFIPKLGPAIKASWLNGVDLLVNLVFQGANSPPTARAALTQDAPLEIPNGGTAARTAADARASLTADEPLEVSNGGTGERTITDFLNSIFPFMFKIINPQTVQEAAVGVVPSNYSWPAGDPRRFGAVLDGVTDDTPALNVWASVGGRLTFPPAMTALISSSINLVSNTTLIGSQGSTILCSTANVNHLVATFKSGITISGMHLKQTVLGGSSSIAGILLDRCTHCLVSSNELEGMQFTGIWIPGSQYCTIKENYLHDALGKGSGTGDIDLASTTLPAKYNVIEGNFCFGGNEFGIAVWDPDSGVIPAYNIVTNNRVSGCTGYGILVYMPTAADTFNQVIGNSVQDVTGGSVPSGNSSSGAGIYVVGAGIGGTIVSGNVIKNCCILTQDTTLAPAGIGVSGSAVASAPITVTGNVISNMTQYWGILITGCRGGIVCASNTVNMPAVNANGDGIKIANSSNVVVKGNTITLVTTTQPQIGISLFAQGAANTNISVADNTITGGHSSQIRMIQSGGSSNTGVSITGNHLTGGDASCIPLVFDTLAAQNVLVANNNIRSSGPPAIQQTSCSAVRYSNNFVLSSGAIALSFNGANIGGFYDKSNTGTGLDGAVLNQGTGMIIHQFGLAAPVAGVWAVGDTVRNIAPSVGGVLEWVCVTAGLGGSSAIFKTISNT